MSWVWFGILLAVGALLSYWDNQWRLDTLPLEALHALVLTSLCVGCWMAHCRYPSIRQFGWHRMVAGISLLTFGSWVDLLDTQPWVVFGIPMGHSWQQAFLEKIVGYTAGIGLVGLGFFQWVPWMLTTRNQMEALNDRLTQTLTRLDERIEAERLNLSRELHDDIAQRLTALGYQVQLADAQAGGASGVSKLLREIGKELSDTLKSVRSLCRNLRPESLFALGLIPALEQWLSKICAQYPHTEVVFEAHVQPQLDARLAQIQQTHEEDAQLHLYRLIQESLRNALKHSGASRIHVLIQEQDQTLMATITDNGQGLPWQDDVPDSETLVKQGHLGIAGLRERAERLRAQYQLINNSRFTSLDPTAPPCGTQVIITLPWTTAYTHSSIAQ
ncbi:MAG: sensor histidine kinase [Vampirovibrionales bacterium]